MKLHLLDRSSLKNSSFTVKNNCYPYFLKIWHYHPELELVTVLKSTGTCFIGDSIEKFEEGEVVLIGKNLPHMWQNDDAYFDDSSDLTAQAIAVHFKKELFGTEFFNYPQFCLQTKEVPLFTLHNWPMNALSLSLIAQDKTKATLAWKN